MSQAFKDTDVVEGKVTAAFEPMTSGVSLDRHTFYDECYAAQDLGGLIWDSRRSPLTNAIQRDIFITTFQELFTSFQQVGCFEAFLSVFRKIFGDNVAVVFTVPGPGRLQIGITATDLDLSPFVARHIEDNEYVFDNVVTEDDDQIVFQTVKGIGSQYELETMLFEMVIAGVYTEITLDFA